MIELNKIELNECIVGYELALAPDVLCVAVVNLQIGDWSAYIKAVPGENHITEAQNVVDRGTKLPYNIAKELFRTLDQHYYWRD
jgi:hypothetical protein